MSNVRVLSLLSIIIVSSQKKSMKQKNDDMIPQPFMYVKLFIINFFGNKSVCKRVNLPCDLFLLDMMYNTPKN